ncbi:hypothetical protein OAP83_01280 [Rickettsiales bacterium]|nr:hypothetical protein [Rickettsiales bacterium]
MGKESEKSLNAGQASHIALGTTEQVAEFGNKVAESMEGGQGPGGLDKAADKFANTLKNSGANTETVKAIATGTSGGLMIAGGLFATYEGLLTLRNASGLRFSEESVEKALEQAEISHEHKAEVYEGLTSALKEQAVTKGGNFVTGSIRRNTKGLEDKFNQAVDKATESLQLSDEQKQKIVTTISQDLGFCRDNKGAMVSYNGSQKIMTSALLPNDLETRLGVNKAQAKELSELLETSDILENGRVVKAPSEAALSACFQMAGIDKNKLSDATKLLTDKSNAVAEVPTWSNRVNMNEKMEGGLVTAMGVTSVAAGVLVLLAGFAGVAGLAAASFGIAIGGLVATSTLVARDIYKDGKESLADSKMAKQHKELAKAESLSPELKREHEIKADLHENRSKEGAGVSMGNMCFMTALALTGAALIIAATGGTALVGIGVATIATFAAGAAVTVYSKSTYGASVDANEKQLSELKAPAKSQEMERTHEVDKAVEQRQAVEQSRESVRLSVPEKGAQQEQASEQSRESIHLSGTQIGEILAKGHFDSKALTGTKCQEIKESEIHATHEHAAAGAKPKQNEHGS